MHPFALLYNHGIRHVTGTAELPRRGAPGRSGCGMGAVWLVGTARAFSAELPALGYGLGIPLIVIAGLVATVDVCIPSMTWRAVFGPP